MPASPDSNSTPQTNHKQETAWAMDQVVGMQAGKAFGKLVIEFQGGRIVRIEKVESLKPPST